MVNIMVEEDECVRVYINKEDRHKMRFIKALAEIECK